jgi:hypothetical protein
MESFCCYRGPLFDGKDWQKPDFAQAHQRGINEQLMNMQKVTLPAPMLVEANESESDNTSKVSDMQQHVIQAPNTQSPKEGNKNSVETLFDGSENLPTTHQDPCIDDPSSTKDESKTHGSHPTSPNRTNHTFIDEERNDGIDYLFDVGEDHPATDQCSFSGPTSIATDNKHDSPQSSPSSSHHGHNSPAFDADHNDVPISNDNTGVVIDNANLAVADTTKTEDITSKSKSLAGVNQSDLIQLNSDQARNLQFPFGCSVWSNFITSPDGEMFVLAKVISASLNFVSRDFYYEVMLGDGTTMWFGTDELAFAPTCPVHYLPAPEEHRLPGEVIRCYTKQNTRYYTVMISSRETDRINVIQDIPSEQIKYRTDSQSL